MRYDNQRTEIDHTSIWVLQSISRHLYSISQPHLFHPLQYIYPIVRQVPNKIVDWIAVGVVEPRQPFGSKNGPTRQ